LRAGPPKSWRAGWTAAAVLEAEKKFRMVKSYRERKELAGKLSRGFGMHSTPQQEVA